MIIITGAAGFIGSCLVRFLNQVGVNNLVLVDDFTKINKRRNLLNKKYAGMTDRHSILQFIQSKTIKADIFIHLGARTDTTETDIQLLNTLNTAYSQKVFECCTQNNIPLIYASSAATYGNGEHGYNDNHSGIKNLQPLNPYGWSKQNFDTWVLAQSKTPPQWYGLKFFNVYGPNEAHKSKMASVIYHGYHQILQQKKIALFKSYKEEYNNGGQLRDFIYVKDVLQIIYWLMNKQAPSGLYNVGTNQAESFNSLANALFETMNIKPNIDYIEMPTHLQKQYQYYTQADMCKLRNAGYTKPLYSLQQGVADYVTQYLAPQNYY